MDLLSSHYPNVKGPFSVSHKSNAFGGDHLSGDLAFFVFFSVLAEGRGSYLQGSLFSRKFVTGRWFWIFSSW